MNRKPIDTLRKCSNCAWCWEDPSVNYRECTCPDDFTEEEVVKYYEDSEDGCPHFKECPDEPF